MRLYALLFTLFVLGAHTASIPDKKDIEKKLAEVVKEVLNKDEVPIENVSSEQELIETTNGVKDVENNLKKSALPSDIPVKVVVEDVQPVLKTDDKKEDNEVSPPIEESSEIVREEIDLKNPGPPQQMQHDSQAPPKYIQDAQQLIALKNSEWRGSAQYTAVQKEIIEMKNSFNNKMTELYKSLQDHWSTHPAEKEEENIQVRASVREDVSNATSGSSESSSSGSTPAPLVTTTSSSQWSPFGWIQNVMTQYQEQVNRLNQTVTDLWNNSTNPNSTSNGCNSGSSNQQSDEPVRPGIWHNVQNFFQNAVPPAGAQSDSPQPTPPDRPFAQVFQNVMNQASNLFSRPGQSVQPQPQQQQLNQATTQEGANAVPVESKPEGDSQKKPEQATAAAQPSGPITQIIGSNPVVQGLAGAVQRIQHAIIPTNPRNEVTKSAADKEIQATKGGWLPPPPPHGHGGSAPGDNSVSNSSGVDIKPEETAEKEVIAEPTKEEKTPEVQKTE